MTTYNYISNDFTNGVNKEKLINEIKKNIPINFNLSVSGDKIKIVFDSSLTSLQISILNAVISNHNSNPDVIGNKIMTLPISKKAHALTYFSLLQFEYPGSKINNLTHIKFVGNLEKGVSFTVRIYNITNHLELVSGTFTNTTENIIDLGSLNNIPYEDVILEVACRVPDNNSSGNIKLVNLYYD